MKSRVLRIENLFILQLLLVIGVAAYYMYFLSGPSGPVNAESTYSFSWKMLLSLQLIMMVNYVWMLLPLYLMHFFLRVINRRNRIICFIHAITTVAVLAYGVLTDELATSVVPGWHTTIFPPMFAIQGSMASGVELLFWPFQYLFLAYGIVTIIRWKKAQ